MDNKLRKDKSWININTGASAGAGCSGGLLLTGTEGYSFKFYLMNSIFKFLIKLN